MSDKNKTADKPTILDRVKKPDHWSDERWEKFVATEKARASAESDTSQGDAAITHTVLQEAAKGWRQTRLPFKILSPLLVFLFIIGIYVSIAEWAASDPETEVNYDDQQRFAEETIERLEQHDATMDSFGKFQKVIDDANRAAHFVNSTRITDDGTVVLKVANAWHTQPYQMRLQVAQRFQQAWARLYSPDNSDKARISIVDNNGNEVGGSRVWGGEMIWVSDK